MTMADKAPAPGRRALLATAAAAAVIRPARAQTPTPAPQTLPQIQSPGAVPPPTGPHPAPSAVDPSKSYVLLFAQQIDTNTMRALRHELARLVEGGVASATLSISSLGGSVDQALATYGFIQSLPMKVATHAHGWIASAANVLFLAGEDRSADPTARFVFHPTTSTISGVLSEDQVRDRIDQFGMSEGTFAQVYRERTTLSEAEIESFSHGQHIYTAAEAKDRGIVQSIGKLEMPGDGKTRVLFLD